MARPLRLEYDGALYHVTARGNEKQDIYFTPTDYEKYLSYIVRAKEKYGISRMIIVFSNVYIKCSPRDNHFQTYGLQYY